MKWNKVQHRAPDTDRKVLVYCGKDEYHVASYEGKDASVTKGYDWFNGNIFVKPEYWSELPKAPD